MAGSVFGRGLTVFSADLAGCVPVFPDEVGSTLAHSTELDTLRRRQILFGRMDQPGRIHVYSAECVAGERLRVQLLVPKLSFGRGLAPSFAVVAQSLPYSADTQKLPVGLPAGYSAVVAPAPGELASPIRDPLTRSEFFTGPIIDTRTLVGGRCYIVVWSPAGQMGKYALRIGSSWPWQFGYWLRLPFFWWQIRGWFGLARGWAHIGMVFGLLLLFMFLRGLLGKLRTDDTAHSARYGQDGRGSEPKPESADRFEEWADDKVDGNLEDKVEDKAEG
jgi:hypothetical protein